MSDISQKPKRSGDLLADRQSQIVAGIVLIGLGIIFFLQQAGVFVLVGNWWAIFILVPGLFLLWRAYTSYNQAQGLTSEARHQIAGGVTLLVVAGIFIFNLDWGKVWPVFLILAGLWALFGFRD